MSNFANPGEPTNILQLVLANGDVAAPSVVFSSGMTKGMYTDGTNIHLTGLSATPTLDDEAASKAYVDNSGGGVTYPLLAPDGTTDTPSYAFASDPTTGFSFNGTSRLVATVADTVMMELNAGSSVEFHGPVAAPTGDVSDAAFTFPGDLATGIYSPAPHVTGVTSNGGDCVRFDGSNTAGDTRLLLWDVDSGALQRVTVGVADSGGTGFKVLRIPN